MKTNITIEIENALIHKYYFDKHGSGLGRRYALECQVYSRDLKHPDVNKLKMGRVDFITLHKKQSEELITCFEIKVSKADFRSKNGKNFVGDYNYFVIPYELLDYVKERRDKHIGIIIYRDDKLEIVCNARRLKNPFMRNQNGNNIKHNMLTACNSTIRRLYDKEDI